jgi:hypothetical protein
MADGFTYLAIIISANLRLSSISTSASVPTAIPITIPTLNVLPLSTAVLIGYARLIFCCLASNLDSALRVPIASETHGTRPCRHSRPSEHLAAVQPENKISSKKHGLFTIWTCAILESSSERLLSRESSRLLFLPFANSHVPVSTQPPPRKLPT